MTAFRYPHYVQVFDSKDRTATAQGVITTDPVLVHGVKLEQAASTQACRFRLHHHTDGTPATTDPCVVTMSTSGNHSHSSIEYDPPVAAQDGLDWILSVTAGATARAHVYFSPLR